MWGEFQKWFRPRTFDKDLIFGILTLTLFPKDRKIYVRIKGFLRLGVISDFRGPFKRSEGFGIPPGLFGVLETII